MTASLIARSAFGPTVTRAAAAAAAVGLVTLILGCILLDARISLAVLAATWLLFAGVAAGAVALSAMIRVAHGRWARQALPAAEATAWFFVPAFVVLVLVLVSAPVWMPRPQSWQVHVGRAARDLGAAALLFVVGRRYVARSGARSTGAIVARPLATVYLLLYAAALSLWSVDLVMSLRESAPNTVLPAFYFCGALLGGIASTTLSSVAAEESLEVTTREDLGKLLFAFGIIWGYLLWSAYLPVWYDNLPAETAEFVARWDAGWRYLSMAILLTVLVIPCSLLLNAAAKRARVTLVLAAASVLAGLAGEHLLLVLPALTSQGGPIVIILCLGVSVGMTGAYVLALGRGLRAEA